MLQKLLPLLTIETIVRLVVGGLFPIGFFFMGIVQLGDPQVKAFGFNYVGFVGLCFVGVPLLFATVWSPELKVLYARAEPLRAFVKRHLANY